MKLKRFLALALSLAMVLTIVPAFGLTASAASTKGVIDELGATVLWSCPDGNFNDTAIADAFSGWTSNITSGYVNVKTYSVGNVIQYYVDGSENKTTITSPGYGGNGEDAIIIEWKAKGQNPSDLYFDFSFTDKDGAEIAFLKLDKNYTSVVEKYNMGYPAEGTDCAIVATNNDDGTTHKVEYYVAGAVVSTIASKEGKVNGFGGITSSNGRWSTAGKHIGFADLTIAAYTRPAAAVDVTATYTVNGTTIKTVTKTYDAAVVTGASFDEVYVYENNDVYYAAETTLSESAEIAMTRVAPYTSKVAGESFVIDGTAYEIDGESVVRNGNFVTGDTSAWTNRPGTAITGATVAYDEAVGGNTMTISTSGAGATNSIGTKWSVETGKTYYLSFYVGGSKPESYNYTYNRVFYGDGSTEIVAYGADMTDGAWKKFEKVFTAAQDTILFQGSWASNIRYANVELVPVKEAAAQPKTTTINYRIDNGDDTYTVVKTVTEKIYDGNSISIDAGSAYFAMPTGVTENDDRSNTVVYLGEGAYYDLPAATAQAGETVNVTVTKSETKIGVLRDTAVSRGGTSFYGVDNNNVIRVASAGEGYGYYTDANGDAVYKTTNGAPSTLGIARDGIVEFPVVELEDGEKAIMTLYVGNSGWEADYTMHDNGFANGTSELRFMATVLDSNDWVEAKEWVNDGSFDIEKTLAGTNVIFSDFAKKADNVVTFDVTDAMAVAKAAGRDKISFRLLAQYGAYTSIDREKTLANATEYSAYAKADQEGKAAYIEIRDGGVALSATGDATLTVNGNAVSGKKIAVEATDDVRLNATGAIVVGTDAGYYEANKTMSITAATAFENTAPATLGLDMVEGAQVRIGNTNLGAGEKLDVMADSGIRFIATADYNGTVVSDSDVEFGIKVQADASDNVSYVKATKFQNDEKTAFSTAIVNLLESNYNRKYTATAYAKVAMADGSVKEFNSPKSVTRSIYQVSAGIMKNGEADAENAPYTVEGVVKNVLNAYINQTGIRLTYANGEMTVEEGKYTGDVFFTVESVEEAGATTVTITPDATWGTKAEIAEWWTDYVRVNNNNSTAKTYISNASVDGDGVLTFTFTVPAE